MLHACQALTSCPPVPPIRSANHAHKSIDYSVIHMWPDNASSQEGSDLILLIGDVGWGSGLGRMAELLLNIETPSCRCSLQWRRVPLETDFGQQWIDAHSQVAAQLGKPLVLEEFGEGRGGMGGVGWPAWPVWRVGSANLLSIRGGRNKATCHAVTCYSTHALPATHRTCPCRQSGRGWQHHQPARSMVRAGQQCRGCLPGQRRPAARRPLLAGVRACSAVCAQTGEPAKTKRTEAAC